MCFLWSSLFCPFQWQCKKEYNATFATSATLHSLFCMEETLRGAKTKVRYSFWTLDIWDVFLNKWGMRRWKKSFKKMCSKNIRSNTNFSQNAKTVAFLSTKIALRPTPTPFEFLQKIWHCSCPKNAQIESTILVFLSLLPLLLSFSFYIFFLFFAYLHLFWSTSSGIFYFLHNKSQFRPLLA